MPSHTGPPCSDPENLPGRPVYSNPAFVRKLVTRPGFAPESLAVSHGGRESADKFPLHLDVPSSSEMKEDSF